MTAAAFSALAFVLSRRLTNARMVGRVVKGYLKPPIEHTIRDLLTDGSTVTVNGKTCTVKHYGSVPYLSKIILWAPDGSTSVIILDHSFSLYSRYTLRIQKAHHRHGITGSGYVDGIEINGTMFAAAGDYFKPQIERGYAPYKSEVEKGYINTVTRLTTPYFSDKLNLKREERKVTLIKAMSAVEDALRILNNDIYGDEDGDEAFLRDVTKGLAKRWKRLEKKLKESDPNDAREIARFVMIQWKSKDIIKDEMIPDTLKGILLRPGFDDTKHDPR